MTADLAVVIVTYNSAPMIDGLLDSLPAGLGGLRADVIVVDNGSQDDTMTRLAARTDCRVIASANRGYSAGINLGVESAGDAPAVLILNPDTRLHENSVPPLLDALGRVGVGIVAPRILSADGSLHFSLRREPTLLRALGLTATKHPALSEFVNRPEQYGHPAVVDWALGAALLVSRECLNEVGGWDESFFLYSEETDFCLRARKHGFVTRYEPAAVLTHIGAQSGQSHDTHSMQIINRVRLYHRHHGEVASWAYFALTLLSEASWVLRGHRQSRASIRALVHPRMRPTQLGLADSFLPR